MVVEGQKTEPIIINNLKKYFLKATNNTIVKVIYGTVIYKLYKEFFPNDTFDEDLELFPVIKENIEDADGNILSGITRNQVSQIYLFFDYDSHVTNADDIKLHNMLKLFNNETENGKLYVSYPMVEAIKNLSDDIDFKDTIVFSNDTYKNLVSKNCNYNLKGLSNLTQDNWDLIIDEHCKKANFIVNNKFEFPDNIIEQIEIFVKQKEKYIDINDKVAVLSAFPLFLLDYYGVDNLNI